MNCVSTQTRLRLRVGTCRTVAKHQPWTMREGVPLILRERTTSEEERFLDLSINDSGRPQLLFGFIYRQLRDKDKLVIKGKL